MANTREDIANAWSNGRPAKGSNYHTDGQTIWSYGWHVTAVTLPDGSKVAFDCHYSPTTTKQTGPAKVAADYVVPCQTCACAQGHGHTIGMPSSPTPRELVKLAAECLKFAHCDYHKTVWCANADERKHYGHQLTCPFHAPDVRRCRATYGYVKEYDRG